MKEGLSDADESGHFPQYRDAREGADVERLATIAENYRFFATHQAAGRSTAYEKLANAVAGDHDILSFLSGLPPAKRQPNLLFASSQYLLEFAPDPATLRELVLAQSAKLGALMLSRRTQTNEAARCALFLPALAALPQPLALLEVGAAAGLTLLPDYYTYDYGHHKITGLADNAPVLVCRASNSVPLPDNVPTVKWRAGIDVNPLDVDNEEDVKWLRCLLWPGEEGRSERLNSAINVARRVRPWIERGDLLDDLPRVAQMAPQGCTVVVYHSAVLTYVDIDKRRAFTAAVAELDAVWLSLEAAGVLPAVDAPSDSELGSLLVRGGNEVLATADTHGTWINWTSGAQKGR